MDYKGCTRSLQGIATPSRTTRGSKKYLTEAPFVLYCGRTRGGYDWITIQCFLNEDVADEESDIYRNLFGDIIQSYEVYDFTDETTNDSRTYSYI